MKESIFSQDDFVSEYVSEIIVSPNKGQSDSVKVSELAQSIEQIVCGLHPPTYSRFHLNTVSVLETI